MQIVIMQIVIIQLVIIQLVIMQIVIIQVVIIQIVIMQIVIIQIVIIQIVIIQIVITQVSHYFAKVPGSFAIQRPDDSKVPSLGETSPPPSTQEELDLQAGSPITPPHGVPKLVN